MRRNKQFGLALAFIVSLFLSIIVWPTAANAAPTPWVTYPAAPVAVTSEVYNFVVPYDGTGARPGDDADPTYSSKIYEPVSGTVRNYTVCQQRYRGPQMLAAWLSVYEKGTAAYPANAAGYLGSSSTQLAKAANYLGRWLGGAAGPYTVSMSNVLAQGRPTGGCMIYDENFTDPATTFYDASSEIDTTTTWSVKNITSSQYNMESHATISYVKCYSLGVGLQTKLAFYELMRTGVVTPSITAKLGPYDSQPIKTAGRLRLLLLTGTTPYDLEDYVNWQTGVPTCNA
jgi:hypothetical protein